MLSPSSLLYESLFFYTHIIIFLISCAAYFLIKFYNERKKIYLTAHFSLIALCSLITGFFHILWFLVLVVLLTWFLSDNKRIILHSALLPFLVVLSLYLKNLIVFDNFTASSWFGMNLSRITVHQLPVEKRKELAGKGDLSIYALMPPFPSFTELENYGKLKHPNTGISLLDQIKKNSGRTNFNNLVYLEVSEVSFKDAWYVIVHYPEYYFSGVIKSFKIYFNPPSDYKLLTNNGIRIDNYTKVFNAFVYGYAPRSSIALLPVIIFPILIIFGFSQIFNKRTHPLKRLIISFLIMNILFVMVTGNFFEFGENNRFRYYTEAFYFILAGIMLTDVIEKYFYRNKN